MASGGSSRTSTSTSSSSRRRRRREKIKPLLVFSLGRLNHYCAAASATATADATDAATAQLLRADARFTDSGAFNVDFLGKEDFFIIFPGSERVIAPATDAIINPEN